MFANVTPTEAPGKFNGLTPVEYLRVVQTTKLQLRLKLLDPTLQALYSLQVFLAVVIGMLTIFCCVSTIMSMRILGGAAGPYLGSAYRASFTSVVAFSLFAIAYRQYRSELEPLVGGQNTILPDFFVAALVVALLATLTAINPAGELDLKQFFSGRILVLAAVAAAAGLELRRRDLLVAALLATIFVAIAIWPPHGSATT
jgi:hypothetical protein